MLPASTTSIKSLKAHDGVTLIPQIGFGTYTLESEIVLNQVIPHAYNCGYRHFDTAVMYCNEEIIGKTLQKHKIPRDSLFLTTKILPEDMSYQKAIDSTKNSLKYLQTDYLDLLLIHWPGNKKERIETWQACEFLKDSGLVKSIGVSNFTPTHLQSIMKTCKYKPIVNQIEIHPLYYDKSTIEFCQKENILLEGYCPFAQNHKNLIKNKGLLEIAEKYEKNVYQVILKWGVSNGFILLPRSSKKEHLQANLDINDFELTEAEIQQITSMNKNFKIDWNPHSIKT